MLNKTKSAGLAVIILVLGGIAFLVLGNTRKHSSSFQQLPDGSVLRLDYVSFTNGTHSYTKKYVTGWRARIVEMLPKTWNARLGWSTRSGGISLSGVRPGNQIWPSSPSVQMTKPASFIAPRVIAFDEFGNTFNGGNSRAASLNFAPDNLMRARTAGSFSVSPSRQNTWFPVF